jgi:hypothetical protein
VHQLAGAVFPRIPQTKQIKTTCYLFFRIVANNTG